METLRIELKPIVFQTIVQITTYTKSPLFGSLHVTTDYYSSLTRRRNQSGHRETRTPLLQSPLHQFDKGGQIYSLLMLCTHYICSPMRNWTSPHRLKVYCLHLSAIGEYVPPLRIELRIFSLRGSSFNHSAIEVFNKTPVGDLNSHTTVLQTGT